MKHKCPWFAALLLATFSAGAVEKDNVPGVLEDGAIVRRNGAFYNNRSLYGSHGNPASPYYWVFAGDRPLVRFGGNPWVDGCFVLGFQQAGGEAKWLLDFKMVEARYHGGRMEWVASDPQFPGVIIALHALPLGVGTGLAAQAQVTGAHAGDRLVWMLGCAYRKDFVNNMDALSNRDVRDNGFEPHEAQGDRLEMKDGVIRLEPPRGNRFRYTLAGCSASSEIKIADADQWKTPQTLWASTGGQRPVACGVTPLVGRTPIRWIARSWPETEKAVAPPNVEADFRAAWERVESLRNRVSSHTPDARFDFMVRAATPALDGIWRGYAYGHSGSAVYVTPFLGWRALMGGMAYGWHDRVLTAARHFLASQVTGESYLDHPALRQLVEKNIELERYEGTLTHPGKNLRYLSKGRLIPDGMSTMYDMQSIFFDQLVEDWRFTADPELEKILRPALELHLDYIARCFDPDGNGAYESFINTYLTDNQWYNGGETAEETAFAYRGHLAARDMARRAGDAAAVQRHEARLALIRKGFFARVWAAKEGHPGAYREQGGHERLHTDAWLPSIVHTLDCPGLFDDEQAASTLHFTEYGLEREQRPAGGVRVTPSNWVPGIWSLRTRSPGEEYHLALGYCLAGMPEGAMEIIRGCYSATAFESVVPGNFGEPWGGTDFSDFLTPFARAAVSGIFGYRPDRPNGLVTIAPQFPAEWAHASLSHPEFTLTYQHRERTEQLNVTLQRESVLELQLPFRGTALKSARLNGQPVHGTLKPGFGRSVYVVRTPVMKKAELVLEVEGELPLGVTQSREVEAGAPVELAVDGGKIMELRDAQGVVEAPQLSDGKVRGRVALNVGHHRLLTLVQMGQAPQWRSFDFLVRDGRAERVAAEKNLRQAPAGAQWAGIDLSSQFNGRVSELFRQEYLAPRPDTISARLGKDAHQTWHGAYMRKPAPAVDVSNTWPRRPAPVYEAALGALKLGQDFTIEAWARADMASFASGRVLELGDVALETMPRAQGVNLQVGRTHVWNWPVMCSERVTHLAAVFRGGRQAALFLNGRSRGRAPEKIDLAALSLGTTLRLGADQKGDKRLLGRIERVALSAKAATLEQLQGRSVDAAPLAGTVADWRIPESADAQVASTVTGAPALVRRDVSLKLPKDLPEPLQVSDGMLAVPQGARFKWNPGTNNIAFTSLWDNWPRKVDVPVNRKGASIWLLVCGSSNPMQVRIANAVLRFHYADGVTEELELVNPLNFWSLCLFQQSKDYDYATEAFSLPKEPPPQAQLGSNCRAMVYGWKLRPGVELKQVTVESLSQEVVIGLMGVSICNPE